MTLDVAGLVEHVMKAWLLLYCVEREVSFHREDTFFLTDISCRMLDFGVGLGQQNTLWQ